MLEKDNELLSGAFVNFETEEYKSLDDEAKVYLSTKSRKKVNRLVSKDGESVSALQKMLNVTSKSVGIDQYDLMDIQKSDEPVKRVERVRLSKDLEWIKDNYGEDMVNLCRRLFPQLLEIEGLLPKALGALFHKDKFLAKNIIGQEEEISLRGVIYYYVKKHFMDDERVAEIFKPKEQVEQDSAELKTAKELLDKAGYDLYECKTDEDIMRFEKYFAPGESLCTFNSVKSGASRLNVSRIWFAVKKNADQLKREDFPNPDRQDEYGTSVISIQFTKCSNILHITNRYNHSVENCDSTFGNDLDNITPGLTDAFDRDYGVRDRRDVVGEFEVYGYVEFKGKYYCSNSVINNVFYCNDNIIIDKRDRHNCKLIKFESHCVLADYFIFDTKTNTVKLYDQEITDCFIETFGKIEKIEYKNHIITVSVENGEDIIIELDANNSIISLKNNNVSICGDSFMEHCLGLKTLEMKKLQKCGNVFLGHNCNAEKLDLPNLSSCGDYFAYRNRNRQLEFNAQNLIQCGQLFLYNNKELRAKYSGVTEIASL